MRVDYWASRRWTLEVVGLDGITLMDLPVEQRNGHQGVVELPIPLAALNFVSHSARWVITAIKV